jgi:glucose/arabinose dehydrogenase
VHVVARGLRIPWGVAFLPDGTALVTERGNDVYPQRNSAADHGVPRILSVTPEGRVTEVQRLPEVSTKPGEGGLLGIAVSPHYAADRWVYVYYSTEVDNRIARLRLGQKPEPILTGIPISERGGGFHYHQGGRLAFGPDGMLYATTGETFYTRDIAQDRGSLGGKILRLTPEGRPAPGNPFGGSPVYTLGHRNVQGLAWDAQGRLYASEFGEDRYDELNVIQAGHNYGWPIVEGVGDDPRFTNPIATWPVAQASPSGVAVAGDRVYVACLHGQRLYRVSFDGRTVESLLSGSYGRLRTVVVAPDGSLWVTTSNRDGRSESDGRGPVRPEDDMILRVTP